MNKSQLSFQFTYSSRMVMKNTLYKQKISFPYVSFFVLFFFFISSSSHASDIIKINRGQSEKDIRTNYTYTVLNKALIASIPKYGAFGIEVTGFEVPNHQTLKELVKGEFINVAMALTTDEWEEKSTPIRIPIRRGIFSYRLLAINTAKAEVFNNIHTLEQLKTLTVGVRKSWTTRKVLTKLGFEVADAYSYDSIFAMLDKNRFDYIPRGIHEIYDELEIRKVDLPHLMVEPRLALYIPSPFYMFVSKSTPQIAARLELGLEKMVEDGSLQSLFEQYYGAYIEKADLENRTIIHLGNPLLPSKTPLERKELWHSFSVKAQ